MALYAQMDTLGLCWAFDWIGLWVPFRLVLGCFISFGGLVCRIWIWLEVGILVVCLRIVLLSRLWWMPLLRLGALLLLLVIIILLV